MAEAEFAATPKPDVTLTLTNDEARTLWAVTGGISGHIENQPRQHTNAIWSALEELGFNADPTVRFNGRFLEEGQ